MKKYLIFLLSILTVLSLAALAACSSKPEKPAKVTLTLKQETNLAEIDVYQTTYTAIDLPALFNENVSGLGYETESNSEHITLGNVSPSGKLNVISDGTTGEYTVTVIVKKDNETLLTFDIRITVSDGAPVPTVKKQIEDKVLDAPVFPHAAENFTYLEYDMDLTEYFEAANNVTYEAESDDGTVKMTCDEAKPYLVTLKLSTAGEYEIRIYAVQAGERKSVNKFHVNLIPKIPDELINGGFEQGLTGWNLDDWGKEAYGVFDDTVDIWGNRIDSDGKYLNGYKNESGTCEFTSSLFVLSGTGYITWKMAGNGVPELKFSLMKYNEEGEDEEIAAFNNWYYKVYAALLGSVCYFKVTDRLSEEFAFVNLDSIVTGHQNVPNVKNLYKAGFCSDPDGVTLDMSDTSGDAFPTDLSSVGYQLPNGDFEQGYTGWYMTTEEKRAYAIYGSKTDIWGNPVGATGNYLYGYANEGFAFAKFHSSLFKVGGTGLITWKMAGNSTADLKFTLMKYNEGGEDEAIATFNNWYFPISQESGFIFRNYRYQIDLETLNGAYCYFVIEDYRTQDFGFICLDDIVTYYETAPALAGEWFDAGYVTDPAQNG